jgi:sugar O-acyltransferase (sialic acid O-acetyltransferase NeuD family)
VKRPIVKRPAGLKRREVRSEKSFEVAIIGSGVSCAYTLIHLIEHLEAAAPAKPVRLVVLEKTGEFWKGVPYGSRSGRHSLLIHSLKEFLPERPEREKFARWLTKNRGWVFEAARQDEVLAAKWLRTNESAMSEGLWDDLYLPRHVFGLYLQQRLADLVKRATAAGILDFSPRAAEVVDIQRLKGLYRVHFAPASGGGGSVLAKKVILAIGSPSNIALNRPKVGAAGDDVCFVDNMYEPAMESNIQRISESLRCCGNADERQVLIIGANAGALETIYTLSNAGCLNGLISKFLIVSPSATFPHRISREVNLKNYCPEHLVALVHAKARTAKQILDAVARDVADAAAQKVNIADIFDDVSRSMITALNQLSLDEQDQFVATYGVEIGKLQRRAGAEYLDVVDRLVAEGRIELLQGRFVRYLSRSDGGPGCEFVSGENRERKVFAAPIRVIINCAGFQDVTRVASPLMRNLIRRKICVPNASGRGFLINEKFEASKNFHVMGPLVAGNLAGKVRVWHAESCARIISLSRQLAEVLFQSDCALIRAKMKEVVLCGAGGQAKVVLSLLKTLGYTVPYILDDDPERVGSSIDGIPIRGALSLLPDCADIWAFLAIEDNQEREAAAERFKNVNWVTLVHPATGVDPSARLGAGTCVAAGAVVNAEAVLGNHVIVGTGASVGHDCIVEDFVQVESGARLGGMVHLGRGVRCGVGSAVIPDCSVGAWATLGPRAVAVKPVPAGETWVGVPARTVVRCTAL